MAATASGPFPDVDPASIYADPNRALRELQELNAHFEKGELPVVSHSEVREKLGLDAPWSDPMPGM